MTCRCVGGGSGRKAEGVIHKQKWARKGSARFSKSPSVAYLADDEGKGYLRGRGGFSGEKVKNKAKKTTEGQGAFISSEDIDNKSEKKIKYGSRRMSRVPGSDASTPANGATHVGSRTLTTRRYRGPIRKE